MCLVFELLEYNLYQVLAVTGHIGFPLDIVRKLGHQLCKALEYLRRPEVNIIHCDLKPENIMLSSLADLKIKLVDFGISTYKGQKLFTYVQSRYYKASEVMLTRTYDFPIDMWSTGCILYELHMGTTLFTGTTEEEMIYRHIEVLGIPPRSILDYSARSRIYFRKGFYTKEYTPIRYIIGRYTPPGKKNCSIL